MLSLLPHQASSPGKPAMRLRRPCFESASAPRQRSNSTSQSVLEWSGSCSVFATTTANRSAGRREGGRKRDAAVRLDERRLLHGALA